MNTAFASQAGLLERARHFSDNDEIEVSRRRQGAGGGRPDPSERADAPSRRRGDSGGGGGGGSPFGGGGGGGGGLGIPGGGRMPIWLVILLIAGYVIYTLITGGKPDTLTGPSAQEPTSPPVEQVANTAPAQPALELPTDTPEPVSAPANPAAAGQKWTVMLYEDADDPVLEEDMYMDMNEVERVGSTDQVRIVAQIDRFKGGFTGDGNWTGARRYFMRKDSDLKALHSDMLQDLGEVNMSSGQTLIDFITWAAKAYPADKYVLVLSDHGMGWPGGWSDADSGGKDASSSIPIVAQVGDNLYTMEIDKALTTARQQAGIDKFELIGMDACLMSHLEVFTMLQAHSRYAVASQETEPALGWAYAGFLGALTQNPGMTGADLGKRIVASYIQDDLRITDDQARADFLRQGSPLGGLFGGQAASSAGQLAREMSRDVTLTAADLGAIPALNQAVNGLAYAMQSEDQPVIAAARSHAESYTNIFSDKLPAPYIDLGNFAQILQSETGNAQVKQAAAQVLDAIHKVVVAEKHGPAKQGSTGVTIYFPNSTLYRSPIGGAQSYTAVVSRFAAASLWDDFLAFHYNDISFKADSARAVVPGPSAASRAPGLGKISLSPITLSAKTAAPGQPVTLRSQVNGQNIGYIYLFVGYYDQAANSINVIDNDYLQSSQTREIGGVFYPKWKETGAFTLKLQWDPTVFQISDGTHKVTALMNPETYGAQPEEAVYTVDGTYNNAAGDVTRRARLYFQGGALKHVYGFNGTDQAGAPSEITPQTGDTFTIQETWLDLDSSGSVTQTATQDGKTLTFGDNMFTWKEVYAAAGKYVVGFVVEDLDGNRQEVFTTVTVQ